MHSYIISKMGDKQSVTVVSPGEVLITDSDNPNWDELIDRILSEDFDGIADLFSLEAKAAEAFEYLSDRVAVRGGEVYFDSEPVSGPLADHLLQVLRADFDVAPLVKFWENLASNPTEHSRENLFRWLKASAFTIDNDGYIVGYKGVRDDLTSIHAGPGIVNGVEANGNLDNSVGNVLEMERGKVEHNPAVACSVGLHVGTWKYASEFGPVVVQVRVNPRDVVSVPTDAADAKMRVRRYVVDSIATAKVDSPILSV